MIPLLEWIFRWTGGLAALGTLAMILYGIWRGVQSPTGRTTGRMPAVLHRPAFYILASIAYFGLCALLWQPLPVSLSQPIRLLALAVGTLVTFAGLGLVSWGRLALGKQYFVSSALGAQLFAGQSLVTTGPYALVRHPIYLGMLLTGAGGTLLYRTWTLVFVLISALGLLLRARREEQVLAAEFGDAWREYCRQTPGFFPWPKLRPPRR